MVRKVRGQPDEIERRFRSAKQICMRGKQQQRQWRPHQQQHLDLALGQPGRVLAIDASDHVPRLPLAGEME